MRFFYSQYFAFLTESKETKKKSYKDTHKLTILSPILSHIYQNGYTVLF